MNCIHLSKDFQVVWKKNHLIELTIWCSFKTRGKSPTLSEAVLTLGDQTHHYDSNFQVSFGIVLPWTHVLNGWKPVCKTIQIYANIQIHIFICLWCNKSKVTQLKICLLQCTKKKPLKVKLDSIYCNICKWFCPLIFIIIISSPVNSHLLLYLNMQVCGF